MLPREIREKAFALYCAGVIPERIKDILVLKSDIVNKWIVTYHWEKLRRDILNEKDKYSNLSDKDQDLRIVESVLGMYALAMKENRGEMLKKLNYKDVYEAVKLRRLLKGETTENIGVKNEVQSVQVEVKKILEGKDE